MSTRSDWLRPSSQEILVHVSTNCRVSFYTAVQLINVVFKITPILMIDLLNFTASIQALIIILVIYSSRTWHRAVRS